jgi:hypothetical protein
MPFWSIFEHLHSEMANKPPFHKATLHIAQSASDFTAHEQLFAQGWKCIFSAFVKQSWILREVGFHFSATFSPVFKESASALGIGNGFGF